MSRSHCKLLGPKHQLPGAFTVQKLPQYTSGMIYQGRQEGDFKGRVPVFVKDCSLELKDQPVLKQHTSHYTLVSLISREFMGNFLKLSNLF